MVDDITVRMVEHLAEYKVLRAGRVRGLIETKAREPRKSASMPKAVNLSIDVQGIYVKCPTHPGEHLTLTNVSSAGPAKNKNTDLATNLRACEVRGQRTHCPAKWLSSRGDENIKVPPGE
jgi:hypothetical protein